MGRSPSKLRSMRSHHQHSRSLFSIPRSKSSSEGHKSETTSGSSISNSSFAFRTVGNRKYLDQENVNYILPVDDRDEYDRVQGLHYVHRLVWGDNFSAPVADLLKSGREEVRVLDVGCGPGIWLLEMASAYPSTNFYGIDIANDWPETIKPPNLQFQRANFLQGLPFPDGYFDFVMARGLVMAVPISEWPMLVNELARVTKSGGYVEMSEVDIDWKNEGPAAKHARNIIITLLYNKKAIDLIPSPHILKSFHASKQFSEVFSTEKPVPLGSWGKQVGTMTLKFTKWIVSNMKGAVVAGTGISGDDYDKVIKAAFDEIESSSVYELTHRFWGRKR